LPKRPKPRTATTPANIIKIKTAIEQHPDKISQRSLSRKLGIIYGSVNNIIHEELHLKAFTKKKVHLLDEKKKDQRKARCLNLFMRFLSQDSVKRVVFSDKSLFL